MGLYNVIEPCVAGNVQFVHPTPEFQPVEIDDDAAKEAVEAGALTPYEPERAEHQNHVQVQAKTDDEPKPKARARSTKADEG